MWKRHGAFVLCMITAFFGGALAEEVPVPDDTVADRVRTEFQPRGLRAGGFTVHPGIGLRLSHDDNIFADAEGEIADTMTTVAPEIEIQSNWSRHALKAGAASKIGRYADNPSEDFEDFEAFVEGKFTTARNTEWRLGTRFDALHEERSSPDDRGGLSPTEYDRMAYSVGYERRPGRIKLDFDVDFIQLDFHDVEGLEGPIDHDDRDRDIGEISAKAGLVMSPETTVFIEAGVESISYDRPVDNNGFARSSDGGQIAIGVELDSWAKTSLEAHIGLVERSFDDPRLSDIQVPEFGGTLVHRFSGLTTLSAFVSRDLRATTLDSASGYVDTRVGAGVDHELRRNLILSLHLYYQDNDYEGIDRREDVYNAELGAHYMMGRNFDLTLDFRMRNRDVEQNIAVDDGYRANIVRLQIVGRF